MSLSTQIKEVKTLANQAINIEKSEMKEFAEMISQLRPEQRQALKDNLRFGKMIFKVPVNNSRITRKG